MQIKTIKRLSALFIAGCFIFVLSIGTTWADDGVAHISGMGTGGGHHVSGADTHGKSEGSKSKHGVYSHNKKHAEGSKGRTWGRGTYKKHGYASKHSEGSRGKRHSGHSSGHGYGHKSHSGSKRGGHGHYSKDPFKHVLQFKHQLGLTEEQVAEIKKQQFEYEKISIRSHAAHKIAHMELDRVIHSENVDEAKARQLAEEIAESKTRKIKAMVEGKLAVMRVLTADQKRIISRMYNRHN